MYWYNPTTRASERVDAPSTDEQAIRMLAGTQDSAEVIKHYCALRRSGLLRRTRVSPFERRTVYVPRVGRARERS
jgi:hypothetical protein